MAGERSLKKTRIAMTGWSVRARFVGSANEESKVSTSKVESPWIRCLPVTRDP